VHLPAAYAQDRLLPGRLKQQAGEDLIGIVRVEPPGRQREG
jgi:hypothetical protein